MAGFKNALNAGANMIMDALRSVPFVSGSTGWEIRRDGGAEFSNLTARGNITVGGIPISAIVVRSMLTSNYVQTWNFGAATSATDTTYVYAGDLYGPMLSYLTNHQFSGEAEASTYQIIHTVSFIFHATAATGATPLFQGRYYIASAAGGFAAPILQERAAADNGNRTVTMTWSDTVFAGTLRDIVANLPTQGAIWARQTGAVGSASAYTLDSITVLTQFAPV